MLLPCYKRDQEWLHWSWCKHSTMVASTAVASIYKRKTEVNNGQISPALRILPWSRVLGLHSWFRIQETSNGHTWADFSIFHGHSLSGCFYVVGPWRPITDARASWYHLWSWSRLSCTLSVREETESGHTWTDEAFSHGGEPYDCISVLGAEKPRMATLGWLERFPWTEVLWLHLCIESMETNNRHTQADFGIFHGHELSGCFYVVEAWRPIMTHLGWWSIFPRWRVL